METEPMMKGDRFRAILAGGGGYGDPFERDPELVSADVSEEKITIGYARKHYGVAFKASPRFAVDVAATKKLRGRHRKRKVPTAAE
jgi:N-methylhydantoinase B